jgi:hypothetical protein
MRLASACNGSKPKAVHNHRTFDAMRYRVSTKKHMRGRVAATMRWPNHDEEPAVNTVMLSEDMAGKREAILCAREGQAKVGVGVWMWSTDRPQSDDGRVGPAVVCTHGNRWNSSRRHLRTGRMEEYGAELWPIRHALRNSVTKRETLHTHAVMKVAVLSDTHPATR